jgi:hypothetical protein
MRVIFTTNGSGYSVSYYSGRAFRWKQNKTHIAKSSIIGDRFLIYRNLELAAKLVPIHFYNKFRLYWLAEAYDEPCICGNMLFASHLKTIDLIDIEFFNIFKSERKKPMSAKFYVSTGKLKYMCLADNHKDAAIKAFQTLKENSVDTLGKITLVSEQGFVDEESLWHDDDMLFVTSDLLDETDQLDGFVSSDWL